MKRVQLMVPVFVPYSFTRCRWNILYADYFSQLRHISVIHRILHPVNVLAFASCSSPLEPTSPTRQTSLTCRHQNLASVESLWAHVVYMLQVAESAFDTAPDSRCSAAHVAHVVFCFLPTLSLGQIRLEFEDGVQSSGWIGVDGVRGLCTFGVCVDGLVGSTSDDENSTNLVEEQSKATARLTLGVWG
jgi:hypothetical protein